MSEHDNTAEGLSDRERKPLIEMLGPPLLSRAASEESRPIDRIRWRLYSHQTQADAPNPDGFERLAQFNQHAQQWVASGCSPKLSPFTALEKHIIREEARREVGITPEEYDNIQFLRSRRNFLAGLTTTMLAAEIGHIYHKHKKRQAVYKEYSSANEALKQSKEHAKENSDNREAKRRIKTLQKKTRRLEKELSRYSRLNGIDYGMAFGTVLSGLFAFVVSSQLGIARFDLDNKKVKSAIASADESGLTGAIASLLPSQKERDALQHLGKLQLECDQDMDAMLTSVVVEYAEKKHPNRKR